MLVGLSGKKQSGKDTACAIMRSIIKPPCIRLALADCLKEELAYNIDVKVEWLEKNKQALRPLLQSYGMEFRRQFYGEDYWINKWKAKYKYIMEHSHDATIIVPDVRYKNELNMLLDLHGTTYRIIAIDRPVEFEGEIDTHSSECELDSVALPSIINDFKDINILKHNINKLIQQQT